jgi:putative transposase
MRGGGRAGYRGNTGCFARRRGGEDKGIVTPQGERVTQVVRKGMDAGEAGAELEQLSEGRDVALRKMLRWKVRYFTDGAVIGSRGFVDDLFMQCRDRFGPKRTSGARKMRGRASGAAGLLWSARDLRQGIG